MLGQGTWFQKMGHGFRRLNLQSKRSANTVIKEIDIEHLYNTFYVIHHVKRGGDCITN
jgi:hypothetical protein